MRRSIGVSLPEELAEQLFAQTERTRLTRSEIVQRALRRYFEDRCKGGQTDVT